MYRPNTIWPTIYNDTIHRNESNNTKYNNESGLHFIIFSLKGWPIMIMFEECYSAVYIYIYIYIYAGLYIL